MQTLWKKENQEDSDEESSDNEQEDSVNADKLFYISKLFTFSGNDIRVLGKINVPVCF